MVVMKMVMMIIMLMKMMMMLMMIMIRLVMMMMMMMGLEDSCKSIVAEDSSDNGVGCNSQVAAP
jgi:hypothetical protein